MGSRDEIGERTEFSTSPRLVLVKQDAQFKRCSNCFQTVLKLYSNFCESNTIHYGRIIEG